MEKLNWINRKIVQKETLLQKINGLRTFGKKVVFTNGCFDLLHRGHLTYLAEAASLGDYLVVGLNTDRSVKTLKGPSRPLLQEDDRTFQLASLLLVDAVVLFDEETPEQLIRSIRPDVLVKGGDYEIEQIAGADFVQAQGGQVVVLPFLPGYSTTSLIEKIRKE